MVSFIAWVAGLWWVLGLAIIGCSVPLGPFIGLCMNTGEDERHPWLYGTTRILLLVFSWAVAGLAFSAVCNLLMLLL